MATKFECGKIYKFTADGEDLPIEHSYKMFLRNWNLDKDRFGYYSKSKYEITYLTILSGTCALCLGEDKTMVPEYDLKSYTEQRYYKLLIQDKIVILLHKEKNLYSFVELTEDNV